MKAEEKKAIENTIELWTWLHESGDKRKQCWGGWKSHGGRHASCRNYCFLCDYAAPSSEAECAVKCPYGKLYGRCTNNGLPFDRWVNATTPEVRKYWAGEALKQLQALLPQDKFKVGDRVKFIGDGNPQGKVGMVSEVRPPKRQWRYGVDIDWYPAYPCHESELEFAPPEVKEIKRVYIAGALSTLEPFKVDNRSPSKVVTGYIANCSAMAEAAVQVLEVSKGKMIPYVPCLDFLLGFWSGDMTEEQCRAMGTGFLEVCDAMLVVSVSRGVQAEVKRAGELGIPVFGELCDLLSHYETLKEVK
jgi:hypothetical protein